MSAYGKLGGLRRLHRAVLQGRGVVCAHCVVGESYEGVGPADWPCSSAEILFSEREIADISVALIASAPPIEPRSKNDTELSSHIAAIWGPAVQEQLTMSTEMLHHLAGEQAAEYLTKPMAPFVRREDPRGRYDYQSNNTSDGWDPENRIDVATHEKG